MIRREYTIEKDDDNGCWMLLEDGVGMARSKSRTVLRRIRDALWAVEGGGLVGLTVEEGGIGKSRGVVQAISDKHLIVRCPDDTLHLFQVSGSRIVEPAKVDKPTPWNDPAIGAVPAIELLKRFVNPGEEEYRDIAEDAEKFLKAREDAQPTP